MKKITEVNHNQTLKYALADKFSKKVSPVKIIDF